MVARVAPNKKGGSNNTKFLGVFVHARTVPLEW